MPEGDTLHRLARRLDPLLKGQRLTRLALPRTTLDTSALSGRRIERVEARGKHLLVFVEGDLVLLTHLKMNGEWHIIRPGERWRRPAHLAVAIVETPTLQAVCFHAPIARLVRTAALARDASLRWLGPDVLGDEFDEDAALQGLRALPDTALAVALLDQRAVAGIGNVWKSELLFRGGLDPFAPVRAFGDDELRALLRLARRLMQANVAAASGQRDSREPGTRRGRPLAVYERGGQPCETCGAPVQVTKQALRWTWSCAVCQPPR